MNIRITNENIGCFDLADWYLPKPKFPLRLSPSSDALGKGSTSRSTSGSSSCSVTSSPTSSRVKISNSNANAARSRLPRQSLVNLRRFSDVYTEEQPGRFERDFDEIEEFGSGEFGRVFKVRSKNKNEDKGVYAVKKSKQFEGTKHRYVIFYFESLRWGCVYVMDSAHFLFCWRSVPDDLVGPYTVHALRLLR